MVKLVNAGDYHAILEFVRDRQSGKAFAVATVVPKEEEAHSCLLYSFESGTYLIDGTAKVDFRGDSRMLVRLPGGRVEKATLRTNDPYIEAGEELDSIIENLDSDDPP